MMFYYGDDDGDVINGKGFAFVVYLCEGYVCIRKRVDTKSKTFLIIPKLLKFK